jgi:hypothetical protein
MYSTVRVLFTSSLAWSFLIPLNVFQCKEVYRIQLNQNASDPAAELCHRFITNRVRCPDATPESAMADRIELRKRGVEHC